MAKHKNWVNEEELTQIIKDDGFLETLLDIDGNARIQIIEQPVINSRKDRPDFLVLGIGTDGQKFIYIVEVKITACLDVLAQLKKYETAMTECIAHNFGECGAVTICPVVVARYYDTKLNPYFEDYYHNMSFYRVEMDAHKNWEIDLLNESAPAVSQKMSDTFVSFFGGSNG